MMGYIFYIIIIFSLFACNDKNNKRIHFGIFKIMENKTTILMDGEINDDSFSNFTELLKSYRDVNQINILAVPGSGNDEVNQKLSQKVHEQDIKIHLLDGGIIASGGVDFFLAGVRKTIGKNTKIGVHSWGGEDDNGNEVIATDFPVGHKYHQPYIDYYQYVGFTKDGAESFYYFTINAASPSNIHWMSEDEIAQYKLLKP